MKLKIMREAIHEIAVSTLAGWARPATSEIQEETRSATTVYDKRYGVYGKRRDPRRTTPWWLRDLLKAWIAEYIFLSLPYREVGPTSLVFCKADLYTKPILIHTQSLQ